MIRSRIVGTGRAVPPRTLTNDDLSKMVDTSDSWIVERTGIRERHILDPSLAASDLADGGRRRRRAARPASIPSAVDCIIVGTVTGDCPFPATATFVQKKLGATAGGCAFDLSAACAGFLYGVSIADVVHPRRAVQERAGHRRRGAVAHRRLDRPRDLRAVRRRRGRGADDRGRPAGRAASCRRTSSRTARCTEILWQPAGGSREPLTPENIAAKRYFVKMNGREVYKHAVRNMAASARAALDANGLKPDDVAWVIGHQANLRILEGVSERVGIPMERFFLNVDRYGNTSSASVPTALDEAIEQKQAARRRHPAVHGARRRPRLGVGGGEVVRRGAAPARREDRVRLSRPGFAEGRHGHARCTTPIPRRARCSTRPTRRSGISLSKLCFEGPEAELTLTANAQPAILATSVAALRALRGAVAGAAASPSRGIRSASTARWSRPARCGSPTRFAWFTCAASSCRTRCRRASGAMAAILGLSADDVAAVCREAAGAEVVSAGEPERRRAGGDRWAQGRRRPRLRRRQGAGREARDPARGQRAVPLRADAAGGRPAGGRARARRGEGAATCRWYQRRGAAQPGRGAREGAARRAR